MKPVVYEEIFRLEDVVKGLDAIAARRTWGKPILKVKDENVTDKARL